MFRIHVVFIWCSKYLDFHVCMHIHANIKMQMFRLIFYQWVSQCLVVWDYSWCVFSHCAFPPPAVSQRFRHGEEEAAHLPHRRLREGLREDVSSPSSPALAQRREALRLQLDVLREEVHQERRAAKTQEDAHRWDKRRSNRLLWRSYTFDAQVCLSGASYVVNQKHDTKNKVCTCFCC